MRASIFFIFFALIFLNRTVAQSKSNGFRFATVEQLRGIPEASTPYSGAELPRRVDLSDKMPPVLSQGGQGSCTAWAVGYVLKSYQEILEEGGSFFNSNNNISYTNPEKVFSPAFIFNQQNNSRNAGISIPEALSFLSSYGDCKWTDMPYSESDFTTQPSSVAKEHALNYRIDFYRKVNVFDDNEMKAQLNAGYPIVIGLVTDDAFNMGNLPQINKEFIWNNHHGNYAGGHAVVVAGYNDDLNAFKIINSWGSKWGNNGYCWIDYDFFKTVVREGYIAKDRKNGSAPVVNYVPPTNNLTLNFVSTQVKHGVNYGSYGPCIQIDGTVDIPSGYGKTFRVSLYLYENVKGNSIKSNNPTFASPDGNVATATEVFSVPAEGIRQYHWRMFLPYSALKLPYGYYSPNGDFNYLTYDILYNPVLWIDNFAVSYGSIESFKLQR